MLAACPLSHAGQPTLEAEEFEPLVDAPTSISIATGSSIPLRRAPSVGTVITAADIANLGASNLDQVLESVPGLHVARSNLTSTPMYVIRGINLGFNPQVLMLINGVPATSIYTGNRGQGWSSLPIDNIARIEVIRGPGSALYGAEAFAGVINLITKRAPDINGTQAGLRGESFDTHSVWLSHGGKWRGLDVAVHAQQGRTGGHHRQIDADAQTGWDRLTGSQASLAPGPTSAGRSLVDGSLDIGLGHAYLRMGLRDRNHIGSGTGVASALDPSGRTHTRTVSADLGYDNPEFARYLAVSVVGSWAQYKEFSNLVLFPAGFTDANGTPFQDGMIGNPYKWERHLRFNASATYTGLRDHRLLAGWGLSRESLYRVRETKNFNPDFTAINQGSQADVLDVTDTVPFVRPHDRHKQHAYVQDEWMPIEDWTLTAGVRHDHYSDFGSTTNPRLALVWDAAYDLTAKLLYGTAFRAPAFVELYAINNPVVTGNPDLRPETIRTLEAALTWQASPPLQLGANVFRYRMHDIIRLVNFRYENTGHQSGTGLELEARWDAGASVQVSGNYSYQHATDDSTHGDAGNTPHHHLFARISWRFAQNWSAHAQLNQVGERSRVAGDPRPALAGYRTVDLTLRGNPSLLAGWTVSASVRNLFDADVREPSPYDQSVAQPFISIPGDFPQAGRTWMLQSTYRF